MRSMFLSSIAIYKTIEHFELTVLDSKLEQSLLLIPFAWVSDTDEKCVFLRSDTF